VDFVIFSWTWTCQLVLKTGTPLTGVVGPSPGPPGGSNFVSGGGEFSTSTRWLDKPLEQLRTVIKKLPIVIGLMEFSRRHSL